MKLKWLAVLAVIISMFGCSSSVKQCDNELTRSEVISIVEKEIENRFGKVSRDFDREIDIDREGCDYLYFERAIPAVTGGWLGVRINQEGEVIEFTPGV